MAEDNRRLGPLGHRHLAAPAESHSGAAEAALGERVFTGKINLRGGPVPRFCDAVGTAIGVAPPTAAGGVTTSGPYAILWLGPDEWLVVTPLGLEAQAAAALRSALDAQHAAVTDVSDALGVIALTGPDARHVLAKGCGIDVHPRRLRPGTCVRTGLARVVVLIHHTNDAPSYDLYVDRSYADYLWRWLEAAAASMFGIPG